MDDDALEEDRDRLAQERAEMEAALREERSRRAKELRDAAD